MEADQVRSLNRCLMLFASRASRKECANGCRQLGRKAETDADDR